MGQSGYRTAFKATSLLGGVQIIMILINVLKFKAVAVMLGPVGFGVISLFNSVISLITSTTGLGLSNSTVRDIANINSEKDSIKTAQSVKAIKRWILFTGVFGGSITIFLAPLLSNWTFNNDEYVVSFILLSIVVLFLTLNKGFLALLQGFRRLNDLAMANIIGALIGLIVSLPIFYFFRTQGIVPSLIISTFCAFLVSSYYTKSLKIVRCKQSIKETYVIGLGTVKLGVMMALSSISVYLIEIVVKSYITHYGGIQDVGLYQAGWSLNSSYLGMVLTAMSTDYFPRLSEYANDNIKIKKNVNEQAEIALLILAPLIIIMLVFLPVLVNLFYTNEFCSIIPMTRWLFLGSLLKVGSWAVSYIFLAKGDGKLFLMNELGVKLFNLPLYLLGYYFLGLEGIGLAFVANYLVYFILVSLVAWKNYKFTYSIVFWKLLITLLLLILLYIVVNLIFNTTLVSVISSIISIFVVLFFSYRELDKRLDIKQIFATIRKRLKI